MVMRKSARIGFSIGATIAALALIAGMAAVGATTGGGEAEASPSRPTVATEFPGYSPASGEPELAILNDLQPPAGTVARAEGPFDDRFEWLDLQLTPDAVSGSVNITSDVSELLELEVHAGFYDSSGELIGTGTWVLSAEAHEAGHSGPHEDHQEFEVPVPENIRGRATAAAVGIPILVNE